MKGSRNYSYGDAIFVTVDKLRYLNTFLSSKFNNVTYTAYCIDDTKLSPESFEELLQYENPSFKRITGLRIIALSEEQEANIEIQLGIVGFHRNGKLIDFSFSYQDVIWGIEIEKELVERLKEFRPWYWWLTRIQFWWMLPSSVMILILVLAYILGGAILFLKLFGAYIPPSSAKRANEAETFVIWIFIIGSLFLVGIGLDGLIGYRFPRVFFCLGRQNEEYDRRKKIFNIVFGTIMGGIILAVLGNIVSSWII